jgi:N-acetylglutamate synthase-like GNAT family acetyltransferase
MNSVNSAISLSSKIYNAYWDSFFPHEVLNQRNQLISFKYVQMEEADAYLSGLGVNLLKHEHFMEKCPFTMFEASHHKKRYQKECIDHFIFEYNGRAIGVFMGDPIDWEVYYMRYLHILDDFRGVDLSVEFYKYLIEVTTQMNIKKLEAQVSLNNRAQMEKFLDLGFVMSGTELTTRWGGVARMTRFNDDYSKQVFIKQYCLKA